MPKILWDYDTKIYHLVSARKPDRVIINKKRRVNKIVDFSVPARLTVKLKEIKKEISTLTLPENWKTLWNMKVTIIPVVIGVVVTVRKWTVQGVEDLKIRRRVETIQITTLLRAVRILKRIVETWGDSCWKSLDSAGVKKKKLSKEKKRIIITK